MTAYYNEYDKYAAEWLCNLIAAGHIAPGVVDTRSIEDVHPADLQDFTQCHFFAGIGVWSLALRRAGWADDRPVWTGSCPCQPFSAAGQGAGFADERHLWPAFHHLIRQRRPAVVLGEQVASKDADPWIDLVQDDMEGVGYRFGAIPFPSAGVGAPHIRDRLYWVADADGGAGGKGRAHVRGRADRGHAQPWAGLGGGRMLVGLADAHGRHASAERQQRSGEQRQQPEDGGRGVVALGGLGDAHHQGLAGHRGGEAAGGGAEHGVRFASGPVGAPSADVRPGPTNGYWRAADWLGCRDGKWRPVEASPQPLVDGSAESLGRVRPEIITQIEEEVNAATAQTEGGRAAAMRALLEDLGAQAKCGWPTGRLPDLHAAPFLLAFVRQLQEQGWRIAEGVALPRAEATSGVLRSVWHDQAAAGAPHRRGLEEQRLGEPADVVRVLSRILARHASAAWDDAYAAHAEIGFPIGHGSRSRVGRLRGYGNAINAEAARVFIEAVMECQP